MPFRVVTSQRRSARRRRTVGRWLDDLRLFDASGTEVAVSARAQPAGRTDLASGDRHPAGCAGRNGQGEDQRIRSGPAAAVRRSTASGSTGSPPPFLKRIRLEGSGDRARWTLLVAEGTRLRSSGFALAADRVELHRRDRTATFASRGTMPEARESRSRRRCSARGINRLDAPPLTTPVAFERRPSEPGRSRFHVATAGRPPADCGARPRCRRAATSCATRKCTRRVSRAPKPCRPSSAAARSSAWSRAPSPPRRCACPIDAPIEAELDLVVDDGDNPPLDLRAITAEFAELPWIYFEAPEGALAARYGNPSLPAAEIRSRSGARQRCASKP